MYSWRAKIGLISHVGENMEHAFHLYAPEGVSWSSTKIPAAHLWDEERTLLEIQKAAALFSGYDADVVACGAEFSLAAVSESFDAQCAARIQESSGLPAVTGASAAIRAMKRLGCGKIALLSPYGEEAEKTAAGYLRRQGLELTGTLRMDMSQFDRERLPYETADRDFLYQYARSMPVGGAEALFICGESLGAMEIIRCLEQDMGLPVITSQQALFHCALRASGVNAKIPSLGTLMTI